MSKPLNTAEDKMLNRLLKEPIMLILFVCLVVYVIYDSKSREEKYQETVRMVNENIYQGVKEANLKLDEIKVVVRK